MNAINNKIFNHVKFKTKAMETIRKTFFMLSALCISIISFSQAGLGVTSSTRAAVRSGLTTQATKSTLRATTNAATKTLNASSSKAINVTGNTVTAAEAKTKETVKTTRTEKAKLRKDANASAGIEAGVNSQGSFETGVSNSSENADAGIQVAIDAHAKGDVDGENPIKKINQVADENKAMAEEKKAAAKEKANNAKMKTKKELKRTNRETKKKVKNTVPRASAEANAEAKVHASSKSAVQN